MASILWLKMKRLRSDVLVYVIMMVMAVLLTFVFGNAVFGAESVQRVDIINDDVSEVTDAFLGALESDAYEFTFVDETQAEEAVAKGETLAAIHIPAGFGEQLADGTASLTIMRTADSTDIMALENAAHAAAKQTAHVYALADALSSALEGSGIEALDIGETEAAYNAHMGDNAAVAVSVNIIGADAYDAAYEESIHYLMGFNIFFVMFSIVGKYRQRTGG